MKKQVKVEWCENFIRSRFSAKHHAFAGKDAGIEVNCMFKMAERAGLYEHDTYGTPFSEALGNLCTVEVINDANNNFLCHCFKMKTV